MLGEGAGAEDSVADAPPMRHPTGSRCPEARSLKILVVAPGSAAPPRWGDGRDSAVEVDRAATLGLALERIRLASVDAVAVHAELADDPVGLARLSAQLDGTPLLLLDPSHRAEPRAPIDGVLPPDASTSTVGELVRSAAELHRLRRALAEATRERDEHRTRFEALVQGNADGIMVVDGSGTIRFANPMAARFFARPASALVGSPFGHPLVSGETTEIDLIAPRGTSVVVEMRVVGVEWDGVPGHIACLRDAT